MGSSVAAVSGRRLTPVAAVSDRRQTLQAIRDGERSSPIASAQEASSRRATHGVARLQVIAAEKKLVTVGSEVGEAPGLDL